MSWIEQNWKKLLFLVGSALGIASGAAYMGDCDGVGDALHQGQVILEDVGDKPVKD